MTVANRRRSRRAKEAKCLNKQARRVAFFFVFVLVLADTAVIAPLIWLATSWKVLGLVFFGGLLGGAAAASRSFVYRRTAGWEFEDGTKFPAEQDPTGSSQG
jgi:hypothetical protein